VNAIQIDVDGLESIVVMANRCKVAKSKEEAKLLYSTLLSLCLMWFSVDRRTKKYVRGLLNAKYNTVPLDITALLHPRSSSFLSHT
jgi:hypothetical protein